MPMALYKHVANKEDLLDGMVEIVVGEIEHTPRTGDWKQDVRAAHPRRPRVVLRALLVAGRARVPRCDDARHAHYLNALTGLFLDGGLSADLTHHVMHALGNRMWGFSQELFAATPPSDPSFNAQKDALPTRFPYLAAIAGAASRPRRFRDGPGCDDQSEFEFALDLLLDGVEVLHSRRWSSRQPA